MGSFVHSFIHCHRHWKTNLKLNSYQSPGGTTRCRKHLKRTTTTHHAGVTPPSDQKMNFYWIHAYLIVMHVTRLSDHCNSINNDNNRHFRNHQKNIAAIERSKGREKKSSFFFCFFGAWFFFVSGEGAKINHATKSDTQHMEECIIQGLPWKSLFTNIYIYIHIYISYHRALIGEQTSPCIRPSQLADEREWNAGVYHFPLFGIDLFIYFLPRWRNLEET